MMSEFQKTSNEIAAVMNTLFRGRPYRGVSFSNLQMYGPTMSEDVDPQCHVIPSAISTYWPGGLPHMEHGKFGTFMLDAESTAAGYSRIAEIRRDVLSAQLSKRAIRRWNDSRIQWGLPEDTQDALVPMACGMSDVPFATAVFSQVVQHRRIKAGETVANIYFPSMIKDPRFALSELQRAQQVVIDEEQI